jgi:hypothetical protein
MAAGTGLPPHLIAYWTKGPGAAKIQWGEPGDFNRCRIAINEKVSEDGKPLSDRVISGLCATLHKIATGATPGNAPGERRG